MFQTMMQSEYYTAAVITVTRHMWTVWTHVEHVVQMPMKNHERSNRAMLKQLTTLYYQAVCVC
jgi:hypothetical protein